ncbi:MAG TPA: flagellin [Anaerolineae bacterium]|nr:flagellin [Anaerolineae bacterium]HMR65606.1 flagellin [Anaerolineae bacterium]
MANADFTRIATNIGALNALQSLRNVNNSLGIHQRNLATGKRINEASDDPAGLTIATKLNARSQGLNQALGNIGDAKSLLSVAESGLSRVNDILIQMRNKAEAAASDTLGVEERNAVVTQLSAYAEQIDDIVAQTKWNGNKLIDGSYKEGTATLTFQTGADKGDTTKMTGLVDVSASEGNGLDIAAKTAMSKESTALSTVTSKTVHDVSVSTGAYSGGYAVEVSGTNSTQMSVTLSGGGYSETITANLSADNGTATFSSTTFGGAITVQLGAFKDNESLDKTAVAGVNKANDYGITVDGNTSKLLTGASDASDFAEFMSDLNEKLDTVSAQLSKVGALMGRLTFKEDQVAVAQVNVESSYNRIMNADMAFEQLQATKFSILQQTSTTMLAQANTAPQGILSLFR